MAANDVKLCMSDLKNKKCEGYDRIPLCALFGAHDVLWLTFLVKFTAHVKYLNN